MIGKAGVETHPKRGAAAGCGPAQRGTQLFPEQPPGERFVKDALLVLGFLVG